MYHNMHYSNRYTTTTIYIDNDVTASCSEVEHNIANPMVFPNFGGGGLFSLSSPLLRLDRVSFGECSYETSFIRRPASYRRSFVGTNFARFMDSNVQLNWFLEVLQIKGEPLNIYDVISVREESSNTVLYEYKNLIHPLSVTYGQTRGGSVRPFISDINNRRIALVRQDNGLILIAFQTESCVNLSAGRPLEFLSFCSRPLNTKVSDTKVLNTKVLNAKTSDTNESSYKTGFSKVLFDGKQLRYGDIRFFPSGECLGLSVDAYRFVTKAWGSPRLVIRRIRLVVENSSQMVIAEDVAKIWRRCDNEFCEIHGISLPEGHFIYDLNFIGSDECKDAFLSITFHDVTVWRRGNGEVSTKTTESLGLHEIHDFSVHYSDDSAPYDSTNAPKNTNTVVYAILRFGIASVPLQDIETVRLVSLERPKDYITKKFLVCEL